MKTGTTGAPVRREITASPLDVEAGIPKKGTNTPSARELFWSRRTPTSRPRRRASRTSRNPRCLPMSSTPLRRRKRSASQWSSGSSRGRTTTDSSNAVSACAAANSSQLPRWALSSSTPLPSAAALSMCSWPARSRRASTTDRGRKSSTQTSARFMPRCSKDRRARPSSSAGRSSLPKARARLSRVTARRRGSTHHPRSPRRRPSQSPARMGR